MENYGIFYEKTEDGREWVRVKVYKHDFRLSLHENIKDSYENCMEYSKNQGCKLPSKMEWEIINIYIEEIEQVIEEHNGDPFQLSLWSETKFSFYTAFLYSRLHRGLYYNYISYRFSARLLAYPND